MCPTLARTIMIFSVCAPSLVGAYHLHTPEAGAIFLHGGLLCNSTCSVSGGRITYWGGGAQTEKIQPLKAHVGL